jgi:AcrR family transcriptional regulator
MPLKTKATEDRRVQKTQKLLRGALVSLVSEKPYDSIAVKEILDRANVGRSTFYTHFRDKDDLLLSGIHDMLGPIPLSAPHSGKNLDRILWFSIPVFEHHYRHAHAWGDTIGPRGRAILHEHLRKVLTELIAEVLKTHVRSGRKSEQQLPPDVVSAYIASTFVLVLNWWLDRRMRLAPKQINEIFRRLTLPSLMTIWD